MASEIDSEGVSLDIGEGKDAAEGVNVADAGEVTVDGADVEVGTSMDSKSLHKSPLTGFRRL